MEVPKPTAEHAWLKQQVGKFVVTEGDMLGTETWSMIGDVWLIGRGEGAGEGQQHVYQYTIGFDPELGKFVGTFITSMMTKIWRYEGWLDGDILVLEAEGPDFTGEGTTTYRDHYKLEGGTRTIWSLVLKDGDWTEFMRYSSERT